MQDCLPRPSSPKALRESLAARLQEALVMAGMVSLRNDLAVEFGEWWTFNWKTNVITLPKQELETCPEEEICWIILHEAAHAALTRLHHLLPQPLLGRPEVHLLLNCIEDVRIENWLVQRFPGSASWRAIARDIASREDPQSQEAAEQENPASGFLRGLMRFGDTGRLPDFLHPAARAAFDEALPRLEAAFACIPPSSAVGDTPVRSLYQTHPVSRCYSQLDNTCEPSPFEKWVRILQASMCVHVIEHVLPIFLKLVQTYGCPPIPHIGTIRVNAARQSANPLDTPENLKRALQRKFAEDRTGRYLRTVQKYSGQISWITGLLLELLPNHRSLKHVRGCPSGDRLDLRLAAQFEVDRRLYERLWMRRRRNTLPDPAFVIALDASASMKADGKATAAYESAVVMREACSRAAIPCSILAFNCLPEVLQDWHTSKDAKAENRLVTLLKPDGGTRLAAALNCAGTLLEERREKDRFVFLMTDGEVSNPEMNAVQTTNRQLAQHGIKVLAFGLGLEGAQIAQMYPEAELVPHAEALPEVFSRALVSEISSNP